MMTLAHRALDAPVLQLPLALMLVAAPVGVLDVVYFHLWKFRLYQAPSSRTETVIHIVRGFGFSAAAFVLANYRVAGSWFWLVGALFIVDVLINVLDVLHEPRSRAALGGIPNLEYLLHVVGSMFAGAIALSYFVTAWTGQSAPTALLPAALPPWLSWQGNVVAIGALLLTAAELVLLCSSRAAPLIERR